MDIKTVSVIGANGIMGCKVSAEFARHGAHVYMVSRDLKKAQEAYERAIASVPVEAKDRLEAVDYHRLHECVAASDLIFEAVFENLSIKKEVASLISESMRETAISCSGTSGMSITALAEVYPPQLRKRFFGVHFFNPPDRLKLCELTATDYADVSLCDDLEEYLSSIMERRVVLVKDAPAFLGNRIGFQFINEALQYADEYQEFGGVDYIDEILGTFSGRSMPPLATCDFVGLDVHREIVNNLYQNTSDFAHDSFALPAFVQRLIDSGRLGKKSGQGLYQTVVSPEGRKARLVYDIQTDTYREQRMYSFRFAAEMRQALKERDFKRALRTLITSSEKEAFLCLRFLLKYVIYALFAAGEVGFDLHSADHVMALGFNWCPPLAMVDAFSEVTDFPKLLKDTLGDELEITYIENALAVLQPSTYDYTKLW